VLKPKPDSLTSNASTTENMETTSKGLKRPLPVEELQASTSSAHQDNPKSEHPMDESGLFKRPRPYEQSKPSCSTSTSVELQLQLQDTNDRMKLQIAMLESLRDKIWEMKGDQAKK
jgi:hypothetical protein